MCNCCKYSGLIKLDSNIKTKTLKGFIWRFGERITAQLVTFVVSIILARILLLEALFKKKMQMNLILIPFFILVFLFL